MNLWSKKLHDLNCVCFKCLAERAAQLHRQDKAIKARELRERTAAKALGLVKI